ncbi:MAG: hypothetical protein ACE5NP_06620 [Anaerolineae bacterium]
MTTATKKITIDVPEDVWNEFVKSARGGRMSADAILLDLIKSYAEVQREEPEAFDVAEITRAYLSGRLERKGSINDIDINAEEVEKAIIKTFGISDPVELIEKLRSSRW